MPRNEDDPYTNLTLPPLWEENRGDNVPLSSHPLSELKLEAPVPSIPLSEPEDPSLRPRILIADDDREVIQGLGNSLDRYVRALDVRFWYAGQDDDLNDHIRRLNEQGWRPEVVVLDINLAHGGRNGLDYLELLRQESSHLVALAVVLATAQHKRDLDAGVVADGKANFTRLNPREWLERAKPHEPEAILYGKEGSADFLGRLGESVQAWRQVARRRAWQGLLEKVAGLLDGELKVKAVCQTIVDYAHTELGIDHAFVRWRESGKRFRLVAYRSDSYDRDHDPGVLIEDVPLLGLLKDRKPVMQDSVPAADLGGYADLAGLRFLGVGALLENQIVGFITLFRAQTSPAFDLEVDGKPLAILGRLLAAALGRAEALERMRERQNALLDFPRGLAKAKNREAACTHLANFLHREMHGGDNVNGKVTVRLINYRNGLLERAAKCVGMACDNARISIFNPESIYASAVRSNEPKLVKDVTVPPDSDMYLPTTPGIHAELCVPLSIGGRAIGAVNLEHTAIEKYKEHDQPFVESAAALVAQALENLHSGDFAEGMLAFVGDYPRLKAEEAESLLRERLHEFCGYSVLIALEPSDPDDLALPWRQVGKVDMRLNDGDQEGVETLLATLSDNPEEWRTTWFAEQVAEQEWVKETAAFCADEKKIKGVPIARIDGTQYEQKADAILWLRRQDAPPYRALLLLWGLPPFMSDQDVLALGRFARLFSTLQEREDRIRTLMAQTVLGEQAAAIGHVMQHFRHRLTNGTGKVNGYLDNLETDLNKGNVDRARLTLAKLRPAFKNVANAFGKAQGYVKVVEAATCGAATIVNVARGELMEKLESIDWSLEDPDALSCWTDSVIAGLILYSLLENAADALKGRDAPHIRARMYRIADGRVCIRIEDNGPGVLPKHRDMLMRFGFTTKSDGLGSALAFAKVRAHVLGAELRYAPEQPLQGAAFELLLPTDEDAFIRATAPDERERRSP